MKKLLLASMFLSGCVGDILYLPVYAAKQITGRDRAFLDGELSENANKEEIDRRINEVVIPTLQWIDNYNKTVMNESEKIKIYIRSPFNIPFAFIMSPIRLPVLRILGNNTLCTDISDMYCRIDRTNRRTGTIESEEDNEINNIIYTELPKFYYLGSGGDFIYLLDRIKEKGITFPNIPGIGLAVSGGNQSLWKGVFTDGLLASGSLESYTRSIFTSKDWDFNSFNRPHECRYVRVYRKYLEYNHLPDEYGVLEFYSGCNWTRPNNVTQTDTNETNHE